MPTPILLETESEKTDHLPQTQFEICAFIRAFRQSHAFGPSLLEIGTALKIGKSTVHYHTAKLLHVGVLAAERSRGNRLREGSLRLTPDGLDLLHSQQGQHP